MSTHPKIRTHCHREITLHITHRAERKAPVVISIVIESSSFLVKGKVNSETWWVAFLHFFFTHKNNDWFFPPFFTSICSCTKMPTYSRKFLMMIFCCWGKLRTSTKKVFVGFFFIFLVAQRKIRKVLEGKLK